MYIYAQFSPIAFLFGFNFTIMVLRFTADSFSFCETLWKQHNLEIGFPTAKKKEKLLCVNWFILGTRGIVWNGISLCCYCCSANYKKATRALRYFFRGLLACFLGAANGLLAVLHYCFYIFCAYCTVYIVLGFVIIIHPPPVLSPLNICWLNT